MPQIGAGTPSPTPPSPPRESPSPPPVFPTTVPWKSELDEMFVEGKSHTDILKRAGEMLANLVLATPKLTELQSPDVPYIQQHHQTLLAITSPARIGGSMSVEEVENAAAALIYIQYPLPEFGGKGRADALLDALVEADPTFVDPRPPMQTGGRRIQKGGAMKILAIHIEWFKNGNQVSNVIYADPNRENVVIPEELKTALYMYLKGLGFYIVRPFRYSFDTTLLVGVDAQPLPKLYNAQTEDGVWKVEIDGPYTMPANTGESFNLDKIRKDSTKEGDPSTLLEDKYRLVKIEPNDAFAGAGPVGAGAGPPRREPGSIPMMTEPASTVPAVRREMPPKPDEDPTGGRRRNRTYRRRGKRTYRHSAGSK